MDSEEVKLEEKCENLMNVVVESRKRFGKMCVEYEQKTSLMENKMLNLQLETISNYRFKSKNSIPHIDVDDMKEDVDIFATEILERQRRIENLKKNLRNVQLVALQLKEDRIGRKLREPLTAEDMLSVAKSNILQ
ncbi:unnamed protein product, partial [Iphiclides podalirius]